MLLLANYFLKHQQDPSVQAVFKGLRPAIIGLIAAAALVLCNAENFADIKSVFLFVLAFILTARFQLHPIKLILAAGLCGWLLY